MGSSGPDVTQLLVQWTGGDQSAFERLAPLVYTELRRLARRHMANERRGHTLQATALVNEAFLRLVDMREIKWQDRAHFLAMSSRLMRRILVDAARARGYRKRGNGVPNITLDESRVRATQPPVDVVALDDALHVLAARDERKSRVVELRFFAGLSLDETATVLNVSRDTVMRDWKLAKNWLYGELTRSSRDD